MCHAVEAVGAERLRRMQGGAVLNCEDLKICLQEMLNNVKGQS